MARILIVEDDRPFADALALTLQLEGHNIWIADNARDGVRLGVSHCPEVVIADWMLRSDWHGGEVCRRIRDVNHSVGTIIITGYVDAMSEVSQWGAQYSEIVIEKPFHKQDILRAIDHAMAFSKTMIRDKALL
jgi:DNA-binding NtrC family response regulator